MPKKSVKIEFKNFIKGLITEASPVNFPPEASSDEENFQLNRDGTRDRRLGLDFEQEHTLRNLPVSLNDLKNQTPVTFEWRNVNGDSGSIFLVMQTQQVLNFFDLQVGSLSTDGYKGTITLSSFPTNTDYSFASIDGRLVVAAGANTIAVVTYNGTSFAASYETLKTRDVWGVEVTGNAETDIAFRPSTLSAAHQYNLYNQSWGIPRKDSNGTLVDPANHYQSVLGVYPSNSETVWPGLQYQPVATGQSPFERIYANLYAEVLGATTNTSRGYFIIDVIRRGESRAAAIVANKSKYPQMAMATFTTPADYSSGGATIVTEFAGRVFYAGFNGTVVSGDKRSPDLSNFVFFSQLVKSAPDITKCYQEGDPTSRESNDVVETDGGFIRLSGVDKIISLVNLSSHLIVIANNGVWTISGGSDYGFSATNFKTQRISNFGSLGTRCVVEDSSRVLYWSEDGIYAVGKDQIGEYTAQNITLSTIQSFYEAISNTAKEKAIGIYDAVGKKIRWIYRDGELFTGSSETKELVLDLSINAFYVNRIMKLANNSAELLSGFRSAPFQSGVGNTLVLVDGDEVFSGSDEVVVPNTGRQAGLQTTRYLVVVNEAGTIKYTFAYYNNPYFKDWEQVDNIGVDAKAYMVTGEYTADDSSIHKQIPYLTIHFYRTENGVDAELNPLSPSGCFIRTMWDWANGYKSNKWSPLVQAYRYRKEYIPSGPEDDYDTGFEVVTSRNKVRGRGKAFSLYFETEPGKDCRIIGWNLALNGNSVT